MVIRRNTVPALVCAALALAAPVSLNAAAKPSPKASAKGSGPGALTGMWLLRGDDFGRRETPPFTPQAAAAAEKARKAVDEGGQVLSAKTHIVERLHLEQPAAPRSRRPFRA